MPTQVRFRRGNTIQNDSFTGASGEISINTETKSIRVHDGSTTGGTELVPYSNTLVASYLGRVNANIIPLTDNVYSLGSASNKFSDLYLSGQTIFLGDITLKAEGSGLKVFSGASEVFSANAQSGVLRVAGQTGSISNAQLFAGILNNDGAGSTLDADFLDGLAGGGGGSYALKANTLAVFASTTSAELAGVISDETGSGSLVFAVSPTLTGTPQVPTAANATSNAMVASTEFVQNAVANLIDSAPAALNTLNELANALGDDANFSTTVLSNIGSAFGQANLAYTQANTAFTAATSAFDSSNTKVATVAGVTATNISNAILLDGIKTVDGVGSGLDADTLDGLSGGGSGSYALKANTLAVFASTTSAELAGVISDETGSGSLVFATSPTLAGTPQAPTAAIGTANTMIATTAFASNASALASGIVNPSTISGSYTGITGVGTIAAGTWQGSSISTTYTDAKVTSVANQTGAISNSQLLSAILSVDGVGSNLDADTLDGLSGGGSGSYALKANTLAVFASTTSAELAGVISDETGTGVLVFNNSPVLLTPNLGTPSVAILTNATGTASSLTAGNATNATNVAITDDTSTNSTHYVLLGDATSGNDGVKVSSTKLTFNPSTGILTATDFNTTSDERTKENIQTLENALDSILNLRGVKFNWKESGLQSMGLIAQETMNVVPEVVSEDERGMLSIRYGNLVGLLVESIKTLNQRIEDLESRLK